MGLTDPENLVEVVEMTEREPETWASKVSPYRGIIFIILLLGMGFVVDAKMSFDRQADLKERQERMEKAIEELQKQSEGMANIRQDVKHLDDKVQGMGDNLNRRLDELMQSEFSRRQPKGF